ncbi:uncharacterized protein LOC576138 [Strongylocentrotus purpuratus]|uniref:Uncharacterized protein n=1 Tax=Strongylocentrotus purpuratus TaxID=7668 RepID=A0A7M7THA9_STRPU|nr:uncharacterized protein LOC576138 [Strongylocentrotus purpuratus]|eukprot:XP_799407.1 PREDICTED: uncharacterized protein LOC576138 [Strongylocentrotus purpuratus]
MANLTNLTFLFVALVCLFTSGCCSDSDEGSGDSSGSGTESMFTDVTEVITEVVTDADEPSDIQAFGLVITNDFSEFTLDVDNIVTYNVTIKNVGGTDIAAGSSDLYDILITVSDNADPTASGAETMDVTPLLTSATNLDAGITAGETIVIENVHTMINIPSADCSTYMYDTTGYVCVQISKASGASFTDDSTTNNYYCLSFGDVVDGYTGTLECSACVAKISLIALLVSTLLAYFTSS